MGRHLPRYRAGLVLHLRVGERPRSRLQCGTFNAEHPALLRVVGIAGHLADGDLRRGFKHRVQFVEFRRRDTDRMGGMPCDERRDRRGLQNAATTDDDEIVSGQCDLAHQARTQQHRTALPGENAPALRFSTLARPVNSMTSSTRDHGMPLVRARPRRWV